MTMFIKLEEGGPVGHPITEENLRYLLPGKFPYPHLFVPTDVESLGFGIYEITEIPTTEYPFKPVEVAPDKRNGIYFQTWSVIEMTEEEKLAATENESRRVRSKRDVELIKSDWTQLADAPITYEEKVLWTNYRQKLRDIPSQAGFPWKVVWPTISSITGVVDG